MAYMPLDKSKLYLETEKMPKIWDLSQPWGWDTPLWPFPGYKTHGQAHSFLEGYAQHGAKEL